MAYASSQNAGIHHHGFQFPQPTAAPNFQPFFLFGQRQTQQPQVQQTQQPQVQQTPQPQVQQTQLSMFQPQPIQQSTITPATQTESLLKWASETNFLNRDVNLHFDETSLDTKNLSEESVRQQLKQLHQLRTKIDGLIHHTTETLHKVHQMQVQKYKNDLSEFETLLLCVVCQSNKRNTILFPCTHNVLCGECWVKIQNTNKQCPYCRTPVNGTLSCKLEN